MNKDTIPATIENNNNYKMWRENHSYTVDSLRRSRFGIGYVTAPTITIEEPKDKLGNVIEGGVRATATCTISNGQITTITMTNKGSGYIKAPTVTVSGGNPTAPGILHPVLKTKLLEKLKKQLNLIE